MMAAQNLSYTKTFHDSLHSSALKGAGGMEWNVGMGTPSVHDTMKDASSAPSSAPAAQPTQGRLLPFSLFVTQ